MELTPCWQKHCVLQIVLIYAHAVQQSMIKTKSFESTTPAGYENFKYYGSTVMTPPGTFRSLWLKYYCNIAAQSLVSPLDQPGWKESMYTFFKFELLHLAICISYYFLRFIANFFWYSCKNNSLIDHKSNHSYLIVNLVLIMFWFKNHIYDGFLFSFQSHILLYDTLCPIFIFSTS